MSSNPYNDAAQVPPPPPGSMPPPERKKLSGCAIAGIGCGALLIIMVIIALLVGWWAWSNARTLTAGASEQTLTQLVNQSNLPPDQKQQRLDEIEQMTEDFEQDRIGYQEYFEWVEQMQLQLSPHMQPSTTQPAPTAPPQP